MSPGPAGTLLRMALVGLVLGATFGALAMLRRRTGIGAELSRKLAHVAVGLIALSFAWLFAATWPVVVLSVGGLLFAIAGRRWGPARRLVGPVLHGVTRPSIGDYCIPLVVPILHALAMPDRLLYAVPILVLTLADAAAALVGTRLGRRAYRTDEGSKTVEGSLALAAVAGAVVLIALLGDGLHPGRALGVAAMIAMLTMLGEAICVRGLDNLVLPLGTYALLRVYLDIPAPMLATRLGVGAAFVILAILWHRRAGLIGAAGLAAALVLYASWAAGGWVWTIPPLGVLAALPFLGARSMDTREQDLGVIGVLAMGAVPMAWLFLDASQRFGGMLAPFVASCCAILGVIGVVRGRHDRAGGRWDRWMAPKLAGVAIVISLGCALGTEPARAWMLSGVAVLALALAGGLMVLSPLESARLGMRIRWLARSAIIGLASLIALFVPMP